ncbi:MAG: nucleoside hydrolase [Armatimonadetes bacterium]|nr:nucleoside hydrolase [Candidatus Hippobium faecium]
MKKIPVILDTDICDDIDDLYALMVCIMHPRIELKAVTLVYSEVVKKARFVSKIFRLMNVQNIPIGIGTRISRTRIEKNQMNPKFDNLICYDKFVKPEDPENALSYPSAQEVLKKVLDETDEKVNIVCIGSLSNIGEMLGSYPNPQDKINLISLMGGEIEKQMSEHNIMCDPEAAQVVFNSGINCFMGTFFQTKAITFPEKNLNKYFQDPENNTVHKIFRECHDLWWGTDPYIYDLAPLYYLLNPELYETEEIGVKVELNGTYTRGYTVPVYDTENKNVRYSKKINQPEIVRLATDLYNGKYTE